MVGEQEYEEVCDLLSKGAKLYVARDAAGRHKLKFKTGPFGMLTKRYTIDPERMEQLRRDFNLDRD